MPGVCPVYVVLVTYGFVGVNVEYSVIDFRKLKLADTMAEKYSELQDQLKDMEKAVLAKEEVMKDNEKLKHEIEALQEKQGLRSFQTEPSKTVEDLDDEAKFAEGERDYAEEKQKEAEKMLDETNLGIQRVRRENELLLLDASLHQGQIESLESLVKTREAEIAALQFRMVKAGLMVG